uniref:GP-PDE domain-containing protein n=1 Tax=Cyclopterus lumpus TaxID=8103 RepID=A0A8C2XME3_CYCLU
MCKYQHFQVLKCLFKPQQHCVCASGRRGLILGLYLSTLSALYLVPLGLYSPCIKEDGTLGPAPALIGHRGAPMLAPENTLMAFEKAVEAGSGGLETDVTISLDGVPFLMHDQTLRRTTNVQQVFPNRTDSPAAMFTWTELEELNAGAWFLSVSTTYDRLQAEKQTVCSLQAFLHLAARRDKQVIFDLYRPPRGHPYRDTWIQRTLEVIQNESSIHSSQVLWLPSELRALVQDLDPELQQVSGSRLPLEELQNGPAPSSTNLYVVSQPWLFSLAWCCGVQSVTSNAPQLLSGMSSPLFLMVTAEYAQVHALKYTQVHALKYTRSSTRTQGPRSSTSYQVHVLKETKVVNQVFSS